MSSRSEVSESPRRLNDSSNTWFTGASTPSGVNWDLNMFNSPASAIPPPPIIFSTPPVASGSPLPLSAPPTILSRPQQSPARAFFAKDDWLSAQRLSDAQQPPHHHVSQQPQQPQSVRTMSRSSSCCSVSQGKAEIQTLLTTFKADLDHIMSNNFGPSSENIASPLPNNSPTTLPAVPGSWPNWPEGITSWAAGTGNSSGFVSTPHVAQPTHPCVNMWCMGCGQLLGGPWYGCDKCSWHVLVRYDSFLSLKIFVLIGCLHCSALAASMPMAQSTDAISAKDTS